MNISYFFSYYSFMYTYVKVMTLITGLVNLNLIFLLLTIFRKLYVSP